MPYSPAPALPQEKMKEFNLKESTEMLHMKNHIRVQEDSLRALNEQVASLQKQVGACPFSLPRAKSSPYAHQISPPLLMRSRHPLVA